MRNINHAINTANKCVCNATATAAAATLASFVRDAEKSEHAGKLGAQKTARCDRIGIAFCADASAQESIIDPS